ncbi:MAG: hypothetical protein K0Q43_2841 [Ramlibacter sp.]|jgi:hypothetical protein|nr:hypothetical protein [Ramlibacter sp.]
MNRAQAAMPALLDTDADPDANAVKLTRACAALWTATLALMTAFMQNPAPAHRVLIARKIAKNLKLLHEQECFTTECRMIFSNLAQRWTANADRLTRQDDPRGGFGLRQPVLAKNH